MTRQLFPTFGRLTAHRYPPHPHVCELGSPKRRHFQRQRAASESMDQDDGEAHRMDLIQYIARTQDVSFPPRPANVRHAAAPSTPPPSLGRYL